MNENNENISQKQWMFLTAGFINGSVLLLSLVDSTMKQDTWMAIISGYAVSIPFIASYFCLSKKFPGMSLIEIHNVIYGKVLGVIISIAYSFFFFLLFSFNYRQLVEFYFGYIFFEINPIILYVIIALFCAYAVKKGASAIAKVNLFAVAIAAFSVGTTFLLLLGNMDFSNFFPMFDVPIGKFAKATYVMACIPYCEVLCLMMVTPYVQPTKKLCKFAVIGTALSVILILFIDIRSTAALGASRALYVESSFQAVRLINIGNFLTRMELLVALSITAAMFIKISVIQFAAVKSLSQILKLKTYIPLILPLTALGIVNALISFNSSIENTQFANYYIVFAMPFEFIIPILSLLIAKLRKLPKTKEVAL